MRKYPRVLVVANNCFSQTNSNGRTLGNFFIGWPKDSLAQFSLGLDNPDFDICDNYYCITDKEALQSFICGGKNIGKYVNNHSQLNPYTKHNPTKRTHKTAMKMLCRHMVWQAKRWFNNQFTNWIDDFNPDLVLLQSGDSAFMLNLARSISEKRGIPLVIFNTEAYYFFDDNYMEKHWTDSVLFPLYTRIYRNSFKKLMEKADHTFYGNQLLKADYDSVFHKSSSILFTTSELEFQPKQISVDIPTFSYLGNLELDRPEALVEVSSVLKEICTNYKLDIYGKVNDAGKALFNNVPSVCYHGSIPYSEVIDVIHQSDILFHAESQKPKWVKELRYAFSTKIADSISSGSNFILFAHPSLACSKYIIETKSAWYAKNREELKQCIEAILSDSPIRKEVLDNAKEIARKNHNKLINNELFYQKLCEVCTNSNI